ncbi:helix-turn-helix transcriptional regulator [Streptomyces sp. OE57]|uniref:helix-turn-helix transcriptional regulator n=1 Tax=Streptomyces lacaronensis TaxID=3379885 RepID=UPI0039B78F63
MTDPQKRRRKRRPRGAPLDHSPEGVAFAREAASKTKRALAEALRISEQLMCDIEAGRRNAPPDLLERMAAELNCPVVVLQAKPEPSANLARIGPAHPAHDANPPAA